MEAEIYATRRRHGSDIKMGAGLNVFDLDADLIARYKRFARSFTSIRADDLRGQIDHVYASDKFWPEPLIGLNPQFKPGRSTGELTQTGLVDREIAVLLCAHHQSDS